MNDLISRKQAIELINLNKPNVDEKTKYAMWQFDKDLQTIKTMPSVEKTGKWVDTEFLKLKECSCCGARWGIYSIEEFDFCPTCGAYMRGEEDVKVR